MKKALLKNSFKEIKTSYKRFISILLIALLGVGFFAGLRATSPDMVDTIDKYYKEQNVYDIQIMSTLGLTNSDIDAIKNIENVENVYGTYSEDILVKVNNKELVSKILTIEEINKPRLIEGSMPSNANECLVEPSFLTTANKNIGDTITLEANEENELLKELTLKIVGTAESPLYISRERGTTSLGSGTINNFIYVSRDNIESDVYTEIYVTLKDAEKYTTSSNKYENYVEETKDKIEGIKEERETARYNELIDEANEEIQEAENDFNTQKADGEKQLADAEAKIEDGKKQITTGESEIKSNEEKSNKEFANAEKKIQSAKAEIEKNEKTLEEQKQNAQTQIDEANTKKIELTSTLQTVNQSLDQVTQAYNDVVNKLNDSSLSEEEKATLTAKKQALETQKQELETNKMQLQAGITEIENKVNSATNTISDAQVKIESAKAEVSKQEKTLASTKKKTETQLSNAKAELETSKQEIQTAEAELVTKKEEFNTKIADAETELIDAKEKVNEIESAEWYILDRNQNSGYVSFIQDTQSVDSLSIVFPIVFFAIAILVSLTSMTRMVEEDRTELGTLKSLGYNKAQIMFKYILYSSLACIIGGVIGIIIGLQLIPRIIWMMYSMMYTIPEFVVGLNSEHSSSGLALIYICIVGATIYAAARDLKEKPANLLRPKAPKLGKRVLLERVKFIWKRLNFSQKVTIRNIFRYKKRFLMTIIGIMGCTALIVTGFGIRDSIRAIMPDQYEKVFNYDLQINLKADLDKKQKQDFINSLTNDDKIEKLSETYMSSISAINENVEENVQIIVPNNNTDFNTLINLTDVKSKNNLSLPEDGVLLTDKAAQLLGVEAGDNITLKDTDENETNVKVTNVVENYVYHYIYMSKSMYENLYDKSFDSNVILTKDFNLDNETEDNFVKDLMNMPEVASVTRISTAMNMMNDTMKSLNYVVVILIVSAGLLAFVVLYNLSNVNISERIRELATIKVLGFYDKEVYLYITRETIILTAIGLVLGLVAGYFLDFFILETCEINMLRFRKFVAPLSFVFAALITILFTIIVNIVTYFALKKINMIESLKSVE
mgnify:CR=1 FL=1